MELAAAHLNLDPRIERVAESARFATRRAFDREGAKVLIKVCCTVCGEVEIDSAAISLLVTEGEADDVYTFVCPLCGTHYSRTVTAHARAILLAAGVCAQIRPRAQHTDDPPLTSDDLIDLHFDLERFEGFNAGEAS